MCKTALDRDDLISSSSIHVVATELASLKDKESVCLFLSVLDVHSTWK